MRQLCGLDAAAGLKPSNRRTCAPAATRRSSSRSAASSSACADPARASSAGLRCCRRPAGSRALLLAVTSGVPSSSSNPAAAWVQTVGQTVMHTGIWWFVKGCSLGLSSLLAATFAALCSRASCMQQARAVQLLPAMAGLPR